MGKRTGNPRGRPRGSRNKRTLRAEAKAIETAAVIMAVVPGAFEGDAHAFLMSVYKDPAIPRADRIDAAGKAIHFEKPRLSAVDFVGETRIVHEIQDQPLSPEDRDREWLAKHGGAPIAH